MDGEDAGSGDLERIHMDHTDQNEAGCNPEIFQREKRRRDAMRARFVPQKSRMIMNPFKKEDGGVLFSMQVLLFVFIQYQYFCVVVRTAWMTDYHGQIQSYLKEQGYEWVHETS